MISRIPRPGATPRLPVPVHVEGPHQQNRPARRHDCTDRNHQTQGRLAFSGPSGPQPRPRPFIQCSGGVRFVHLMSTKPELISPNVISPNVISPNVISPKVISPNVISHDGGSVRQRYVAGMEALRRSTSHNPAATMGMDSNCPIVAPNHRNPRKSSGSRNNSPMMRATP